MPAYPPRDRIVDPAVRRVGRGDTLLLIAAIAMAAIIAGYVVYRMFAGA